MAGMLLGIFGRLFTNYVQMCGFTCGMRDLKLNNKGDEARKKILKESASIGYETYKSFVAMDGQEHLENFRMGNFENNCQTHLI